jgi:NADP-dependent aldehyde dehydrogenase
MALSGKMIIAGDMVEGRGSRFRAADPATGTTIAPEFFGAVKEDVIRACVKADDAFAAFRRTQPAERADLLEAIADSLLERGEEIISRAMTESGLPRGRLEGELNRTANQLRLFSRVLRDGTYLDVRIDRALPERVPPRPDLRLSMAPLGPVAVFGASNFPLAFSVAGGDTASALAAGCPVVVKAHPSHPGTSELVGLAVRDAVEASGLPAGIFSLLFDAGHEIGAALVADPRIQAVGFTGSRRGGMALISIAQARRQPIPVYAEMSSINPVLLLPGALSARGAAIGGAFAGALTLGAGQFCTNPGLLLALEGPELQHFIDAADRAVSEAAPATMLNEGIHRAYCAGVERLRGHQDVTLLAEGTQKAGWVGRPALFSAPAVAFLSGSTLHEETFGACSLLLRCKDQAELREVIVALEGQLTFAIHAEGSADLKLAGDLLPLIERKAGRILFNGFGTGVEVCDAMVHGGPWPATSDTRTTSVGSLAITRFLRPLCYQDVPGELLPAELQSDRQVL